MFKPPMHVLIADDEEGLRFVLRGLIEGLGYKVAEVADAARALAALRAQSFDLAILDIKMPELSGIEVLREALKIRPNLIALMITAFGSTELSLEALKAGAYDYFTKPFELQELRVTIQRALEKKHMLDQIATLESQVAASQRSFPEIIGVCDPMQEVFSLMRRIIDTDVPVLVTGESGTGKELVARALHYGGARQSGPMVKVNCAAIPEQLLESELFGHEKGAFTGATYAHPGKFEQAQGGTLFLDEIGEMPLQLQAKILRALQEHEVERVGGKGPLKVDVRVITATNKNLAEEVAARRFREDLYFRINVIPIELPPLRQRLTDIPLLVDHFMRTYNERMGKRIQGVTPRVMDLLLQYGWPGNIRELENVVQRALIMALTQQIQPNDLPPHLLTRRQPASAPVAFDRRVDLDTPMAVQIERMAEAMEQRLISEALRACRSRQEAADRLGISRKSLHNKMIRYGMMGKD
jgi:DNA-binding NtrC family response regulator